MTNFGRFVPFNVTYNPRPSTVRSGALYKLWSTPYLVALCARIECLRRVAFGTDAVIENSMNEAREDAFAQIAQHIVDPTIVAWLR